MSIPNRFQVVPNSRFFCIFERFRKERFCDFVRPFWITKGEAQEFLGDILGWAGGMRSRGEDSRRGEESQARKSGQEKLGKAIRSGRDLGKTLSKHLARHPRKAGAADAKANPTSPRSDDADERRRR